MDNTQITVADLHLLKNIMDLSATRGAFQAAEMKEIGEVYNKLTAFLDAVVVQAQAQESLNADAGENQGD